MVNRSAQGQAVTYLALPDAATFVEDYFKLLRVHLSALPLTLLVVFVCVYACVCVCVCLFLRVCVVFVCVLTLAFLHRAKRRHTWPCPTLPHLWRIVG